MPRNPFRRIQEDGDIGSKGDGLNALTTSQHPGNSAFKYVPLVPGMSTGGGTNTSILANKIHWTGIFSGCGGTLDKMCIRAGFQNGSSGDGFMYAIWNRNPTTGWPMQRISNIVTVSGASSYASVESAITDTNDDDLVIAANTWYYLGIIREGAIATQHIHTPSNDTVGTMAQWHTSAIYARHQSFTCTATTGSYPTSFSATGIANAYDCPPNGGWMYG